jgi:hypothetical protein
VISIAYSSRPLLISFSKPIGGEGQREVTSGFLIQWVLRRREDAIEIFPVIGECWLTHFRQR